MTKNIFKFAKNNLDHHLMKNWTCFLVLLILPILVSAQKNKIYLSQLDINNNLLFRPNTMNPFTGLAYEEYPGGRKKIHVPIKDGKVHGTVKEWEKNGQKIQEATFEHGVQTGVEKQWFASGSKKLEIAYVNGVPEGVCTEWHKTGGKKSQGYFQNGKEEGEHNWWYYTGDKDQQVFYKNGMAEGMVTNWYQTGSVKLESEYLHGKKDGRTTEYYENGQKQSEGQFKEGAEHGEARFWSKKGTILGIQTFNMGILTKDINYRSGSLHIPGGYLQVFNEKESFFIVEVKGDEVLPQKSLEITYVLDGKVLQLFNNPIDLFMASTKEVDDEAVLKAYQNFEVNFLRKETKFNIQPKAEVFKTASGQTCLHWYFKSKESEEKEQKPRTVQEEHYVSMICNKQVLNLHSIVTNSDKQEAIVSMLKKIAETVRLEKERIDLNTLEK